METIAAPAPAADPSPKIIRLPDSVKQLMTREEAAFALNLSTRALDRFITAGELDVVKLGSVVRISPRALNHFIDAREGRMTAKTKAKRKRKP